MAEKRTKPSPITALAGLLVAALIFAGSVGCKEEFGAGLEGPKETPAAKSPTAAIKPGPAATPTAAIADAAAVVKAQCTKCHGIEKVEGSKFDAAKWDETVTRMQKKENGAVLTDAERKAVLGYLLANYGPAG